MKKIIIPAVAAVGVLLLTAGACDRPATHQDRGGVEGAQPDKVGDVSWSEVFRNVDGLPTIARVCVEGIGFAVPTTGYGTGEGGGAGATPLTRVEAWDSFCATKTAAR